MMETPLDPIARYYNHCLLVFYPTAPTACLHPVRLPHCLWLPPTHFFPGYLSMGALAGSYGSGMSQLGASSGDFKPGLSGVVALGVLV